MCDTQGRVGGDSLPPVPPAALATILDSIADGVLAVDQAFCITLFNQAAQRITGITAEEALGRPCHEILRSTACDDDCLLRQVIESGEPATGVELNILNLQDQPVPITASAAVLRDASGEIVGGVETFRDLSAVESLRREIRRQHTVGDIISKNHRMQRVFSLIPDIAASSASVLIEGETGTGKALVARAVHNESLRREGPYIEVNCGALPDTLLESELFGHVAGAFTDARTDRQGRFELAAGGTIFLDEIGDTSPAMQIKLLRVLESGTFDPVGSSEPRCTDARVIAATNRDLRSLVSDGRFREDLFYRINTVCITLPPLRERREDIPLLVDHFVERFNASTGKSIRAVDHRAMQSLMSYHWPGNVRELQHAIEHAFVLVKGATITIDHLPDEIAESGIARPAIRGAPSAKSILDESQRQAIEAVLRRFDGNKVAASRELGISRSTLWRKMRRLGISVE